MLELDPHLRLVARAAGVVLLGFALLLAFGLCTWALRVSARCCLRLPSRVDGTVIGVAILVAAFCALIGYRLAFNRPERHGSLLGPVGWRVLATLFGALAVVLVLLPAGLIPRVGGLMPLLLAGGCVLAARGARSGLGRSAALPVVLDQKGFEQSGFVHAVELLNDDRTPMEFVVTVLERHLRLRRDRAIRAMLNVHEQGQVLLAQSSREDALRIAAAITDEAARHGHPLVCRAVQKPA